MLLASARVGNATVSLDQHALSRKMLTSCYKVRLNKRNCVFSTIFEIYIKFVTLHFPSVAIRDTDIAKSCKAQPQQK